MRIVQVHAPRFMFEGVTHEIGVKRFKSFAEFDEHIKEQEKKGSNVCFIFSISNLDVMGNKTKDDTIICRITFGQGKEIEVKNNIEQEDYTPPKEEEYTPEEKTYDSIPIML